VIEVAAAIIYDQAGRILIARRRPGKSQAGLWEFPGGKMEDGERIQDCLRRELLEEMSIIITPLEAFGVNEHRYDSTHIRLSAWTAAYSGGTICLSDHDDFRWVQAGKLRDFTFAAADIPFVERLLNGYGQSERT
jgi:8-oxo-dGTP diphosphatase